MPWVFGAQCLGIQIKKKREAGDSVKCLLPEPSLKMLANLKAFGDFLQLCVVKQNIFYSNIALEQGICFTNNGIKFLEKYSYHCLLSVSFWSYAQVSFLANQMCCSLSLNSKQMCMLLPKVYTITVLACDNFKISYP